MLLTVIVAKSAPAYCIVTRNCWTLLIENFDEFNSFFWLSEKIRIILNIYYTVVLKKLIGNANILRHRNEVTSSGQWWFLYHSTSRILFLNAVSTWILGIRFRVSILRPLFSGRYINSCENWVSWQSHKSELRGFLDSWKFSVNKELKKNLR